MGVVTEASSRSGNVCSLTSGLHFSCCIGPGRLDRIGPSDITLFGSWYFSTGGLCNTSSKVTCAAVTWSATWYSALVKGGYSSNSNYQAHVLLNSKQTANEGGVVGFLLAEGIIILKH